MQYGEHVQTLATSFKNQDSAAKGCLINDQKITQRQEYARIVLKGLEYHLSLPLLLRGRKGKQKQRLGKNLLDRLSNKHECVLLFMYDFCAFYE